MKVRDKPFWKRVGQEQARRVAQGREQTASDRKDGKARKGAYAKETGSLPETEVF